MTDFNIWDHYDKLVGQGLRVTGDYDKAADIVTAVAEDVLSGKIDLSKVKYPYTYLAKTVKNRCLNLYARHDGEAGRQAGFDGKNVLVGDGDKLVGMGYDAKHNKGPKRERPKHADYDIEGADECMKTGRGQDDGYRKRYAEHSIVHKSRTGISIKRDNDD